MKPDRTVEEQTRMAATLCTIVKLLDVDPNSMLYAVSGRGSDRTLLCKLCNCPLVGARQNYDIKQHVLDHYESLPADLKSVLALGNREDLDPWFAELYEMFRGAKVVELPSMCPPLYGLYGVA